MEKQPGVYVLESLKNGRYYTGSTGDIKSRLERHNNGSVTATRTLRPWKLKCFIPCDTITIARQAEYKLKRYKSRIILEKVIKDGIFPWNHTGP